MVNQTSAYVAGGVVPQRMGNSHPSLYPYEPIPCADGELIITSGNNGQFRKLCEVIGVARARRRPAVRAQRGPHGQPRRAAPAADREAVDAHEDGVVPRHHRRRCAVRADQRRLRRGRVRRPRSGSSPVVEVGEGDALVPSVRNPITFSENPVDYRRPPPDLDEHGAEIRAWLGDSAVSTGSSDRQKTLSDLEFPTSLGTSTPDEIRLMGQSLTEDLMGKVGFGELAFWLVTLRRPTPSRGAGLRGGAGRPGRPRLHPHGDRGPAHLPVRARLAPGRAGRRAARRRLAVPRRDRGLRPVPARRARRAGRPAYRPDDTRRGTRSPSTPYAGSARPAATSPVWATPCTRSSTRARRG